MSPDFYLKCTYLIIKNGPCRYDVINKRSSLFLQVDTLDICEDIQGPKSRRYRDELDCTPEKRIIGQKGDYGSSCFENAVAEKVWDENHSYFWLRGLDQLILI